MMSGIKLLCHFNLWMLMNLLAYMGIKVVNYMNR